MLSFIGFVLLGFLALGGLLVGLLLFGDALTIVLLIIIAVLACWLFGFSIWNVVGVKIVKRIQRP